MLAGLLVRPGFKTLGRKTPVCAVLYTSFTRRDFGHRVWALGLGVNLHEICETGMMLISIWCKLYIMYDSKVRNDLQWLPYSQLLLDC